jgi:hypothetical protein
MRLHHLGVLRTVLKILPLSIRMDKLTFGHHYPIMNKKYWLPRAADEGMSIKQLREAIRAPALSAPGNSGVLSDQDFRDINMVLGSLTTLSKSEIRALDPGKRRNCRQKIERAVDAMHNLLDELSD